MVFTGHASDISQPQNILQGKGNFLPPFHILSTSSSFLGQQSFARIVPSLVLGRAQKARIIEGSCLPISEVEKETESHSVVSDSLRPHGLYSLWNSSGQDTVISSHSFPSPGDLPNPGIKPWSPTLQVESLRLSHQGSPRGGEEDVKKNSKQGPGKWYLKKNFIFSPRRTGHTH